MIKIFKVTNLIKGKEVYSVRFEDTCKDSMADLRKNYIDFKEIHIPKFESFEHMTMWVNGFSEALRGLSIAFSVSERIPMPMPVGF